MAGGGDRQCLRTGLPDPSPGGQLKPTAHVHLGPMRGRGFAREAAEGQGVGDFKSQGKVPMGTGSKCSANQTYHTVQLPTNYYICIYI